MCHVTRIETGMTEPIPCEAGTFRAAMQGTQCDMCLAGSYTAIPGQATCAPCPAGSSCVNGQRSVCASGTVALMTGQSTCDLCGDIGGVLTNSVFCSAPDSRIQAPMGYYTTPSSGPDGRRTGVLGCEPGYMCSEGIKAACPAGRSAPQRSAACDVCPVGTYAPHAGTYRCT